MYDMDITTLDRVKEYLGIPVSDVSADASLREIIRQVSDDISQYLDRPLKTMARTELYDVLDNQRLLWLRAWPCKVLTGVPVIQIKNDANYPPAWSGVSALAYGDDYLVAEREDGLGRVEFRCFLWGGPQAVQVTYTAGLGTRPSVEGVDGVVAGAGFDLLNSASASFITDGVAAGMRLRVYTVAPGNTVNVGIYPIVAVPSETQLQISGTFPNHTGTGERYHVMEAGLAGAYPGIALAGVEEIVFRYKRKDRPEVSSIAQGGATTMFNGTRHLDLKAYGAEGLTPDTQARLRKLRRELF